MNTDIDNNIKTLHTLVNTPRTHQLTPNEIISINAGISALMVIRDGNYQLTPTDQQRFNDLTKDEITATLRALANIIEKGVT